MHVIEEELPTIAKGIIGILKAPEKQDNVGREENLRQMTRDMANNPALTAAMVDMYRHIGDEIVPIVQRHLRLTAHDALAKTVGPGMGLGTVTTVIHPDRTELHYDVLPGAHVSDKFHAAKLLAQTIIKSFIRAHHPRVTIIEEERLGGSRIVFKLLKASPV